MPQFLRSIGVRIASYTLDSTQPPRCKLSSYATISRFWHVETEKRTFKLLKVYFGEDADTVRGFYNKRRLSYVSNVQIFPDSDTINWADFLFDWLNDRDAHVKAIASGAEFQGHLATAWQCLASLSWPDNHRARTAIYAPEFYGHPLAIWLAFQMLDDRYKGLHVEAYKNSPIYWTVLTSYFYVNELSPKDVPISERGMKHHHCGKCRGCMKQASSLTL